MGEVYRARDRRSGAMSRSRSCRAPSATDPDRRARFDREARLLAALNHLHIGAIYGVEDADGNPCLVLELVEGDTLAERIAKGPIPLTEALTIARQITDALDAAHEKGITHRDLKPANIKITPDGIVKVLDFGLAKAADGDGSGPDLTQSPTVSIGGTHDGVILGTATYMSPEQARGKPVDKRTDVWAFGCVLYEMLTGRVAFTGDTLSDTIAAILDREPDWSACPRRHPHPSGGSCSGASTRMRSAGCATSATRGPISRSIRAAHSLILLWSSPRPNSGSTPWLSGPALRAAAVLSSS